MTPSPSDSGLTPKVKRTESGEWSPSPLLDVKGKAAFITGGSSGIGLGMVRAFCAAGMKVTFTYRRDEHRDRALSYLKASSADVHAIKLDVVNRADMERAATEAERQFGPIHLLCNNAGVGINAALGDASYNDWDWALSVNVTGVFNGIHTFLPRILAHGEGGHILATASAGGLIAGALGVYSTTKFAVVGMMEALRAELQDKNVGVSVFCPGLIGSDIHDSERNRPPEFINESSPPGAETSNLGFASAVAAVAMDAVAAGEQVLNGIRRNRLYIFTHQEFAGPLRERTDTMLASFPSKSAPEARAAVVRDHLLTDMYARELKRLQSGQSGNQLEFY